MPGTANREWKKQKEPFVLNPPHESSQSPIIESLEGLPDSPGPQETGLDYVNALALRNSGEALIVERGDLGGMSSWQVVGGFVKSNEDPMTAVQRTLLEETGYRSDDWLYLGSYMMNDSNDHVGVGHFFCAMDAQQSAAPVTIAGNERKIRWVTQQDLRHALLDGRISVLSYAITISMALLTVLD